MDKFSKAQLAILVGVGAETGGTRDHEYAIELEPDCYAEPELSTTKSTDKVRTSGKRKARHRGQGWNHD